VYTKAVENGLNVDDFLKRARRNFLRHANQLVGQVQDEDIADLLLDRPPTHIFSRAEMPTQSAWFTQQMQSSDTHVCRSDTNAHCSDNNAHCVEKRTSATIDTMVRFNKLLSNILCFHFY
jgi:hypothetical protein